MTKLEWFNPNESMPLDNSRLIVQSEAGYGIVVFHEAAFIENKNKIWWIDSPVYRCAYLPSVDDDEFWKTDGENLEKHSALICGSCQDSSRIFLDEIMVLKPHQASEFNIKKFHILN